MTDKFNKDELEAPKWMDKKFFEEVLKKSENCDSILVTDINISPATVKGDHYASVMFRAKISFDSSKGKGLMRPMIVKTMPQVEGHKMEMLKESYVFETEIAMYSETIPLFEKELRKIGDKTVLGAKTLFYSLKPHKCIIFEDIVPLGYETLKENNCDLNDCKAAFLKLAKWHAVSYKLAAEGNKSVTDYKYGLFSLKEFESSPFMEGGMQAFLEKCDTIDELKKYVPNLRAIQKDLLKRCSESFNLYREANSERLFVLCHGDFHNKNMMFKKNTKGETEDVMLVDFQVCYFGPAVLDVLYGLVMVASENVRKNHTDELVHFYSSNFIETLKKLKFQGHIPKISDFFIEILRHRHWEIFLISTFLPLWYVFGTGTVDPEEILTSDEARRRLYHNEGYIKEIKRLLPILYHRGYLE